MILGTGVNGIELQLGTAYSPVESLQTRKKTAYRGDVETDSGRVTAVLKLLKMEDIAREALCWTLARMLGLPAPQAFLVQVDPSVVIGRYAGNPQNLAFGSEEIRRRFQNPSEKEMAMLRNWQFAVPCAVFDTWIYCTDRFPNNLLIDVNENCWLIDHDEALPNYVSFDLESDSSLFQILREGRLESELRFMKRSAENFSEKCRNIDLEKVQRLVDGNSPHDTFAKQIADHIEFLKNRAEILPTLIAKEFSFRQTQFVLDDDVREEMERYE